MRCACCFVGCNLPLPDGWQLRADVLAEAGACKSSAPSSLPVPSLLPCSLPVVCEVAPGATSLPADVEAELVATVSAALPGKQCGLSEGGLAACPINDQRCILRTAQEAQPCDFNQAFLAEISCKPSLRLPHMPLCRRQCCPHGTSRSRPYWRRHGGICGDLCVCCRSA